MGLKLSCIVLITLRSFATVCQSVGDELPHYRDSFATGMNTRSNDAEPSSRFIRHAIKPPWYSVPGQTPTGHRLTQSRLDRLSYSCDQGNKRFYPNTLRAFRCSMVLSFVAIWFLKSQILWQFNEFIFILKYWYPLGGMKKSVLTFFSAGLLVILS
jgi:hypothetical protein